MWKSILYEKKGLTFKSYVKIVWFEYIDYLYKKIHDSKSFVKQFHLKRVDRVHFWDFANSHYTYTKFSRNNHRRFTIMMCILLNSDRSVDSYYVSYRLRFNLECHKYDFCIDFDRRKQSKTYYLWKYKVLGQLFIFKHKKHKNTEVETLTVISIPPSWSHCINVLTKKGSSQTFTN